MNKHSTPRRKRIIKAWHEIFDCNLYWRSNDRYGRRKWDRGVIAQARDQGTLHEFYTYEALEEFVGILPMTIKD